MTPAISIVIPTFDRGDVLLDTVRALFALRDRADEVLIIDQTPQPPASVAKQLQNWEKAGAVRWLRLDRPSIPRAMNVGLQSAASEIVLFLDDDIVPGPRLVAAHRAAQPITLVLGRRLLRLRPGYPHGVSATAGRGRDRRTRSGLRF